MIIYYMFCPFTHRNHMYVGSLASKKECMVVMAIVMVVSSDGGVVVVVVMCLVHADCVHITASFFH